MAEPWRLLVDLHAQVSRIGLVVIREGQLAAA